DPVLSYSTYLGGSDEDVGHGIAVDAAGNAYVTGYTLSTNFPVVAAFQGSPKLLYNAFVTKVSASGASLVYSTYLGGSNNDLGQGIAVDASGNAYVTGFTTSTDFPTVAAFQGTFSGAEDAFVTKLSASGIPLYSTYLGGSGDEHGRA